jgi:hypothetical protein
MASIMNPSTKEQVILSPSNTFGRNTDQTNVVNRSYFLFQLSMDEEQIGLQLIVSTAQTIALGNRSHNYLLLTLARKRSGDQLLGISSEEQGWICMDDLLEDLSREMQRDVDVYFLNLQIFRIRKQLLKIPVFGALFSHVIERRYGQIRLGHPFFSIVKGECSLGGNV